MATNNVNSSGNNGMVGLLTDLLIGDPSYSKSLTQKYGRWESDDKKLLNMDPEAMVWADLRTRHMQNRQWQETYGTDPVSGLANYEVKGVTGDPSLAAEVKSNLLATPRFA